MDAQAVRTVLAESAAVDGLVATWEDVARPVLVAVAERWESDGRGVEIEHLVSDCVTGVYNAHAVHAPVDPALRPVLLAAMPGELHVLPVTVLSAVLAERGLPCRPLGADLPADALADAVRRIAPAALVLWSQMTESGDAGVVESLPRTRPRHRLFVGGAGWDGVALPASTTRLTSLAEAADVLTRVVTG
jgi:methanogenic corrinoid protein MtbC1